MYVWTRRDRVCKCSSWMDKQTSKQTCEWTNDHMKMSSLCAKYGMWSVAFITHKPISCCTTNTIKHWNLSFFLSFSALQVLYGCLSVRLYMYHTSSAFFDDDYVDMWCLMVHFFSFSPICSRSYYHTHIQIVVPKPNWLLSIVYLVMCCTLWCAVWRFDYWFSAASTISQSPVSTILTRSVLCIIANARVHSYHSFVNYTLVWIIDSDFGK